MDIKTVNFSPGDISMSIYAKTKGTELEKTIAQLAAGEAAGGGLYYALARIARGYGLDDVAETFIEIGNQETNHSGFYATLNGKYPNDKEAFWKLVAGLSKAEFKGDTNLNDLARKLSNMGIPEAAEEVRLFAEQEKRHGEATRAILEKYAPNLLEAKETGKKYVCPVCGFEYEGDLNSEPADWKCPICGVPKNSFKTQE